jgi:hypothetical protein
LQYLDEPDRAIAELQAAFQAEPDFVRSLDTAILAAWFEDTGLAADALRKAIEGFPVQTLFAWRPLFSEVRKQPVFRETLKENGFVEYWRAYGWPQWCRPAADGDIVCE